MPQRMPQPLPAPSRPANEPVTAGVVDDNQQFSEYLSFVRRTAPGVRHLGRDVSLRHLVEVKDSEGRAAADAEVLVHASSGLAMWARTDAAGKFWLHPNAFDSAKSPVYQITVRSTTKGSWGRSKTTEATALLQRGQKSAVEIRLPAQGTQASRAQLDLVFLIDATGSMGDEIDKLKTTLRSIADDVARLPSRPDICYGLVAYRDRTDEFVVRSHDFTNDLNAFQNVLNELRANGGGDYPEAMSEALEQSIHRLSWRGGSGQNTTRMVLLLADAPPQIGRGEIGYDETMQAALGKGIKLFSVGASGLDKQGELVQRQMAQYTGGKFVFLTYANANNPASGPGRETKHDVSNYSVDTLDQLVVRLVKEELALR
jgi:Mg-chelatase subunit ChlD